MAEPRPAVADQPLTDAEFASLLGRLGPFERPPRLAVGLSGGPDSSALNWLSLRWAVARRGGVTALIVDHGLRTESAVEAVTVAARARALGASARVLTWTGPKPSTGIQAAARAARHALLAAVCAELDILHLLLAHHREDQAETIAMRRARGSGMAGLAGMPVVRELALVRILRPLLEVPRGRLLATVQAASLAYVSDPSNDDLRFARAALRRLPPTDGPALQRLIANAVAVRRAEEARLAAWLARHAAVSPLGFAVLATPAGEAVDPAALGRLVMTVGGSERPPPADQARRAADG